ncbi:MAG TPA: hypothetical protein VK904_02270 [Miltoncostaeaceae bacterium]|nr:hypothetical protein [Miltoncostaeaceae bacterium]
MTANAISRALRRLAPRRDRPAGWRIGPWPALGPTAGRAPQRFLLLAGGPVQLLVDDVLMTVGEGAVLRLRPDEARRLIVLDDGREPVWLSMGADPGHAGAPR